jgi:serine/threonine protein kinase
MPLFSGLRAFFASLFSPKSGGPQRPRAGVSDPDSLRPSGPVMSLGPRATVVEASGPGGRYLLKKWIDLPPNARRELIRLIGDREVLNGPGVLAIVSSGEKLLDRQAGYVFCVQEHRPRSLRTWLADLEAPPPLEIAEAVVREVATSLREAHGRGLVHGNLSPDAVFLSAAQGADFGRCSVDFVRYTGMDLAQNPAFTIAEVFPTGRSYLAPEALLGNPADDLSDLYTLGILAYEVFSRKLPFGAEGVSTTQKVRGILSAQAQPLSKARPDVPNRWEVAIMKLLAKDRKLRYRSADEFLRAVEAS